jgi:hypothetical protein
MLKYSSSKEFGQLFTEHFGTFGECKISPSGHTECKEDEGEWRLHSLICYTARAKQRPASNKYKTKIRQQANLVSNLCRRLSLSI